MAKIDLNEMYPSNSHRDIEKKEEIKPPRQKIDVSKSVELRDKSLGSKFKDTFISSEVKDVKSYIWLDVIVPAIQDMIIDSVKNAVEMIFGGRSGRSSKSYRDKGNEGVSYNAYYKSKKDTRRDHPEEDDDYDGQNIWSRTRGEIDYIFDAMVEMIDANERPISVAEVKTEFLNKTPDFTDYKYGWPSLKKAYIKRVRDGYLLVLPKPVPIDE